jgi:predicted O-linked N-acetylglucosamine transferase (SPINDLY family)
MPSPNPRLFGQPHVSESAETWNARGIQMRDQGKLEEAVECYRRAIQIDPRSAAAHNNLGLALRDLHKLDDALASYHRALELQPRSAAVRSNIATVLKDMGDLDAAIQWYRIAVEAEPNPHAGSNLLYALHFQEGTTPAQLWQEHQRWNQQFAKPLTGLIRPHANDPNPERRIKIGYVSPDFRAHPVGRFIFPLLMRHDHSQFQVHCYSDVRTHDGMTELFKSRADVWRKTRGLSDERLAEMVRQDAIDILVDLTMHVEGSRLLVFARKPAPVQVTYLAYPGTTGLETIDYRLTDANLDPAGRDESFYSEKSIRLRSFWCYQPARDTPNVVPPPALSRHGITFGCLNNFCKVSPSAFSTWCELLRRVPNPRLILHAREGSHRQRTHQRFAEQYVDPKRVEFVSGLAMPEYFATYNQIDIALDPFPYPGGTTTCDALWMGVPVVSFPQDTAVSRGGLSILSTVGLTELIARDRTDYVRIAVELAGDLPRLADLRGIMRERLRASPLLDIPAFKADVESAFRWMWGQWCASQHG